MALNLVPPGTRIPFVRFRPIYFMFSAGLLVLSAVVFFSNGLNFGIDFRGGIMIEVGTKAVNGTRPAAKLDEMRATLGQLNLGEVTLQEFGTPQDVLIRIERQAGDERAQVAAIQRVRNAFSTVAFNVRKGPDGNTLENSTVQNGNYVMYGVLNGITLDELKKRLAKFENVEVASAGGNNVDITIRKAGNQSESDLIKIASQVRSEVETVQFRRQEFVGPQVGDELIEAGITATVLALLAIMLYVWFRFEWQFAVASVVALLHDVLLTIGLFSFFQMEFNLATVAAILTIAGYSINDTVVVFDRVRENLRKYRKMPLADLMNQSINETLARTLMTSVTTLLALLALFFFGGEIIRGFSIALIWGVVIGTYSSICLAVPLLLMLNVKRGGATPTEGPEQAPAGA